MTTEQLNSLRINANRFYLDNKYMDEESLQKYPLIEDIEYDTLKEQYQKETGKSVKDLVEWDETVSRIHEPMNPLEKQVVENKEMKSTIGQAVSNKMLYRITYKYDGSSIKAYYDKEGRLRKILGTPDEEYGFDRTRSFHRMFPQRVPKGISAIQAEVLVDAKEFGELARNKANGLTNSKNMKDEVERLAFLRAYGLSFHDGNWTIERLINNLNLIPEVKITVDDKLRSVFKVAENLPIDAIPDTAVVTSPSGDNIQVDGIVVYDEDGPHGYKFYYTESAIVTITDIQWRYQPNNGTYAPVAEYEPIVLNGKNNYEASCNGVPNMVSMGIGIGAKVKVIMANMTIPKIIEVLEPSVDFKFPKCDCGYQVGGVSIKLPEGDIVNMDLEWFKTYQKYESSWIEKEDEYGRKYWANPVMVELGYKETDALERIIKDLYGSAIKCGNTGICQPRLEAKIALAKEYITEDNKTLDEILVEDPFMPIWLIGIDRFNPNNKFIGIKSEYEKFIEEFKKLINGPFSEVSDFEGYFARWFKYSDLQYRNAKINFATTWEALKRTFGKN